VERRRKERENFRRNHQQKGKGQRATLPKKKMMIGWERMRGGGKASELTQQQHQQRKVNKPPFFSFPSFHTNS
jgi:hypothetical protein